MDPVTIGLMLGSTALSMFGTQKSVQASKEFQAAQTQEIQQEQAVNEQRRIAMELRGRREEQGVIRTAQRQRALGLEAATSQGAQYGSGLQGAYGQAAGESGTRLTGVTQNLQVGENIFDLDKQISQSKIQMAQAQTNEATAQGISSLGRSLGFMAGPAGNLGLGKMFPTFPGGSSFGLPGGTGWGGTA